MSIKMPMELLKGLLPFFMLLLVGCQASGEGSSALIAGHVLVTNKFTVSEPTAKTYGVGETISFTVSFPFDITTTTTGGSPRLKLTIGSTTRYATYAAQADLKKLIFDYTFVSGDNDTDGISLDALELNGSTLKFTSNGVASDCDVTTVSAKTYSAVKVDTTAPTISAFTMTNLPGMYNEADVLSFSLTFSENVYVTGMPKFVMTLSTGGAVDVNYSSGSGSTLLTFTYTIKSTDADSNGLVFSSPVSGGTIKDAVGNNANLVFTSLIAAVQTYSASIHVGGQLPFITGQTFPAAGTYAAAQDLDFTLTFNAAVTVSGSPYLAVTIGSNIRQASYLSGSGTTSLKFRYTTVPGDVDADGISVANSITQNSGNIVLTSNGAISFFSDSLNNYYTVPSTTNVLVNAVQPQATAVARNTDTTIPVWSSTSADNIWIIGQDLNITVSFNTAMYVTQTSGTPTLEITVGSTSRQATYVSGGNGQTALVFRYTILEGDLDTDGTIGLVSLKLNGGVIADASNTNSLLTLPTTTLSQTKIDGVRPTVSNVTAPSNAIYSSVSPYAATNMNFSVTWSEAVNLSSTAAGAALIALDIGGSTVNAEYASGTNTVTTVHRPSSLVGKNDSDGIQISSAVIAGTAVIKDDAGNTASVKSFSAPVTTGILVDTTAPTITSMTAITANGTYKQGDTLDFLVTFSESVTVTINSGYPRIPVVIGSTMRYLTPIASATSTTHTFRYEILSSELDTNGVAVLSPLQLSGAGTITDGGRNTPTLTFTAPSTPLLKVDSTAPTVSSVTKTANGTYDSGTLQITINYNEAVTVTGTPSIAVSLASGTVNLNYASGSGTTSIVFSYSLTSSDYDFDGLPTSVNTIVLNGGTMQDAVGNNAPATFTAQNLSSIFVVFPGMKLWATSNFTSKAPAGSPGISNSGVISTETCGAGTCRTFNGDDALNLSGSLNSITTVFIVFKTPASEAGVSYDLFSVDINLTADSLNGTFDLTTADATVVNLNGTITSGTFSDADMATSSTKKLMVEFVSPMSYGAGTLIDTSFNGAIGEVMAFDSTLTGAQKTAILNYLNAKY